MNKVKEFEYCGRKWGVIWCDKDTPCYTCKKEAKKFNSRNTELKKEA